MVVFGDVNSAFFDLHYGREDMIVMESGSVVRWLLTVLKIAAILCGAVDVKFVSFDQSLEV